MEYHLAPVADIARELATSPAGLDAATARQRLAEHGPNELAGSPRKTVWQLLLHQLADVMILVLLAAAGVSVLVGEAQSAYVILAIVGLNAAVGFLQEYRADKALEALQRMATSHAQVLRGGPPATVPTAELVPGDVVLPEAGNVVPADVRFLETHALKVGAAPADCVHPVLQRPVQHAAADLGRAGPYGGRFKRRILGGRAPKAGQPPAGATQ